MSRVIADPEIRECGHCHRVAYRALVRDHDRWVCEHAERCADRQQPHPKPKRRVRVASSVPGWHWVLFNVPGEAPPDPMNAGCFTHADLRRTGASHDEPFASLCPAINGWTLTWSDWLNSQTLYEPSWGALRVRAEGRANFLNGGEKER